MIYMCGSLGKNGRVIITESSTFEGLSSVMRSGPCVITHVDGLETKQAQGAESLILEMRESLRKLSSRHTATT